jgi:hypothetical protein
MRRESWDSSEVPLVRAVANCVAFAVGYVRVTKRVRPGREAEEETRKIKRR